MSQYSAGAAFRKAVQEESPLQVVGAINANHALLAKRAGFRAIYLSGGGVAAGSLGLPDLGITNLDDVLTDCAASPTSASCRCWWTPIPASARGLQHGAHRQVDDQVRRCRAAHRRPGRRQALRPSSRQGDRHQTGDGRPHQGCGRRAAPTRIFVIMARTDALAVEGLDAASNAPAPASKPARTGSSPRPLPSCRCTGNSSMQ